jgi:hypothetical protein
MGVPKLGLLQAAKTAKGAMVRYAMPNINRAGTAVKRTVKATGDFAKQQKGNILKIFDAGKNKLKSVGNKVSSELNSLSGKLNRINDKYIGGKLNKANERIISPKIEKFAVNPFNKFIGSGPGKNATLKEQLAWAGKATVKSIGVGVAKGAVSVGGAMATMAVSQGALSSLSLKMAAKGTYYTGRAVSTLNRTGANLGKALPIGGAMGKAIAQNLSQMGDRTRDIISGGTIGVMGEAGKSALSDKQNKSTIGEYIFAFTTSGAINTLPIKRQRILENDPSKEAFKSFIGSNRNIPEWQRAMLELVN